MLITNGRAGRGGKGFGGLDSNAYFKVEQLKEYRHRPISKR